MRIFFDIDDTLFPTTEFSRIARKNALKAMVGMGLDKTPSELYKLLEKIIKQKGSNYKNHFDDLCKELKIKRPSKYIAAAIGAYHNTKSTISPYSDVPKTLITLKEKGHKIYIATNGSSIKQWDKLIRLGVAVFFDDVFVSEELKKEKSKDFFKKVIKQIGAQKEECIMIGDREKTDITPAKQAGIKTIRIRQGKFKKGKTNADYEIKHISQILKIVG